MSPVKRRRRLPTLVNRGLGLLEVIFPRGPEGEGDSCLPPGQRDASGFWYPANYARPGDIFTPQQRQLQAAQRSIQRRRMNGDAAQPPREEACGSSPPKAPPETQAASPPPAGPPPPSEMAVPLPSVLSEAAEPRSSRPARRAPDAGRPVSTPAGAPILPGAD